MMNRFCRTSAGAVLVFLLSWSRGASAGIEECNNLRLEDAGSCEIRGNLDCQASCDELGVYKKACATKLHTVCKEECVLDPEPTCEDECTETCTVQCDLGKNVICIHNCFGECTGNCDVDCESAADPAQCVATCEANCDGECDIKCKPLVEGDCYKHCIECCGGSCTAAANMDCQQTCQVKEFETCEYEFRADCQGSCSGDGALFCDNEFALAGTEIPTCVAALAAQGVATAEAVVDVGSDLNADLQEANSSGGFGCSTGGERGGAGTLWGILAAALGVSVMRRRRTDS
jgi:MYXO-CTERM domain-containing protein